MRYIDDVTARGPRLWLSIAVVALSLTRFRHCWVYVFVMVLILPRDRFEFVEVLVAGWFGICLGIYGELKREKPR